MNFTGDLSHAIFIFYSNILKLWLGNKKTKIILTKIMKSANKTTLSVK